MVNIRLQGSVLQNVTCAPEYYSMSGLLEPEIETAEPLDLRPRDANNNNTDADDDNELLQRQFFSLYCRKRKNLYVSLLNSKSPRFDSIPEEDLGNNDNSNNNEEAAANMEKTNENSVEEESVLAPNERVVVRKVKVKTTRAKTGATKRRSGVDKNNLEKDSEKDEVEDECDARNCMLMVYLMNSNDKDINWIQCNSCFRWFHYKCLGLEQSQVDKMEHYFCSPCRHACILVPFLMCDCHPFLYFDFDPKIK